MITAVTSGKASPGASTSVWAFALSWPRPLLVVDADPAGGDLAAGLLPGRVSVERGLISWAATTRRDTSAADAATELAHCAVQLPEAESVWFVPGFATSAQGASFTDQRWQRLADALEHVAENLGRDVLVDTGRIVGDQHHWPLLRAADRVVLAVRPSVRSVHAAQDLLTSLRYELGDLDAVSALVIGDGPYTAAEVTTALNLPLAARLPTDHDTANVLSDGAVAGPRLDRSPLMTAARRASAGLLANETVRAPRREAML